MFQDIETKAAKEEEFRRDAMCFAPGRSRELLGEPQYRDMIAARKLRAERCIDALLKHTPKQPKHALL